MQILSPAAASQGSAAHQRTQPFGLEERFDAADGSDSRTAANLRTVASCGMSPIGCFPSDTHCTIPLHALLSLYLSYSIHIGYQRRVRSQRQPHIFFHTLQACFVSFTAIRLVI